MASMVPSALQRSTAVFSPLQVTLSATHTMSSMGTQRKESQRNPPGHWFDSSHSRSAQAPVASTQYSSASQAVFPRQKNSQVRSTQASLAPQCSSSVQPTQ